MKLSTVILTTLAIFIALLPYYVRAAGGASGGDEAGESAYFTYLLTNQFIYELTRQDGTSPVAATVQTWIQKIGEQFGVVIQYSKRLYRLLVNRANNIRRKVRQHSGSIPKQKFLQLTWELKLHSTEVEVAAMGSKIKALEAEVSSLRDQHSDMERQVQKLVSDKKLLLKNTRRLSDRLNKSTSPLQERGRSIKQFEDYSESHKRRLKRARSQTCTTSLSWLHDEGFAPISIQVRNLESGNVETITLNQADTVSLFGSNERISEDNLDVINMMLYVKDWYNVSGEAYHEFASICKELPRHYKIKDRIRELNKLWSIKPTPYGTIGLQQSLEDRLRIRVAHLIEVSNPDAPFLQNKTLRVKLSGDGTNVGKRLHLINFTFTLLDEGSSVHSSQGNHLLAILKEPEKYDTLKIGLADIRNEVENLKTLEHSGIQFTVNYFLGGDLKFLAIVTGIDSASSTYACIWCKVPNDQRYDAEKQWSMSETAKGARTIEENIRLAQRPKSRKEYNVSNTPLFPSIPITNVVIDNLHMFLRVCDVLIDLLIIRLRFEDSIDKVKKFAKFDSLKYKHVYAYQQFVSGLGIPGFEFYIGQTSKALKCRTLTGPEKLKVCQNIDIKALLPLVSPDECSRIQHLWTELVSLNMIFSKPASELPASAIEEFERRARQWGRDFVDVYQSDRVTPYIHAMMNHVHEFMHVHGSILPFTQQGLEKLNHNTTKNFFRSTCHRGEAALQQLIEKQNRLEHLSDLGVKRQKIFHVSCSNCSQTGHNKLTCSEACQMCGHKPYHKHLIVIDSKKVPSCQRENCTLTNTIMH